jgi:hypothetical protein
MSISSIGTAITTVFEAVLRDVKFDRLIPTPGLIAA